MVLLTVSASRPPDSEEHVMSEATQTLIEAVESGLGHETPLVEEDLLVEEVSIDGMCGVY
jgi:mycofactocin precursor